MGQGYWTGSNLDGMNWGGELSSESLRALSVTGTTINATNVLYINTGSGTSTLGPSTFTFNTGGASPMFKIDSNGIGIGHGSPVKRIHLKDNNVITGLRMEYLAVSGRIYDINPFRYGINNAGFEVRDITSGITHLAIDTDGFIGVGTPSPNAKLHVVSYNGEGTPSIASTNTAVFQRAASSASNNLITFLAGSAGVIQLTFGDKDSANSGLIEFSNSTNEFTFSNNITATKFSGFGIMPIGSVTAWLKSFANTPSLPSGWVECNGQTLSDAASVYNGQTIPNLNGNNYFLRGNSTSGGTGGSDTHTHDYSGTTGTDSQSSSFYSGSDYASIQHTHDYSGTTTSTDTKPPYYEVVWIMRIK